MLLELRDGSSASCSLEELVVVNVCLAVVDGVIAILAIYQLIRIHSRNSHLGWTRQKVFHLLVGSSNIGYFVYFVLALVTTCKRWLCWSYSCGFILMAFPKILLFTAFLLMLSFWVDLCHQPDDEEEQDEEFRIHEALLENSPTERVSSPSDRCRICFPFHLTHVGVHQRIVIWVSTLIFLIMMTFAALIWILMGRNRIDSLLAKVYVDVFALAVLLLGGALGCYGLVLCLKMRKVRSERASSEMWKVAGLALLSVLCFTPSTFVAVLTDIPVLHHWHGLYINGLKTKSYINSLLCTKD